MPLFFLLLIFSFALRAREAPPPDDNFAASYDEVLRDLVQNLEKDERTAADAASKLASLGKRSIPVLADIISHSKLSGKDAEKRSLYFAILALSKIKAPAAGKILAPVLTDPKTDPMLRLIAVDAAGLETCDEGIAALQKIAGSDPDTTLRKKALHQLALIPQAWAKSEKLFVDALADPDDEIRTIAAKLCYWTPIFTTATDRLIEMAEKDPCEIARVNALNAIGKTHPLKSVPALVRICAVEDNFQKQALRTLIAVTGIPFKDAAAVANWWTSKGQAQFAQLEEPKKDAVKKDDANKEKDPPARRELKD